MKKSLFKITAAILGILFVAGTAVMVSAEIPYDSYTYWSDINDNSKSSYNRAMYTAELLLDADSLGIAQFSQINDISADSDGNLYILDSNSRIVVLNGKNEVIREIGAISGTENYDKASGIYVHTDGTVYICDTEQGRIIHSDSSGNLIKIIKLPESPLIPHDFIFRPTSVTLDQKGYIYVVSEGSYYGALLYSPEMEFLGFYGANTVSVTLSNVISNILNRMFPNNERKGNTSQRLPYTFVDIAIDDEGFIYTCNGYSEQYDNEGQIRKLSPGTGTNILDSDSVNFADAEVNTVYSNGLLSRQDIMDIEVDKDGFIYGLESAFGKIFIYDEKCRTLTVFGGGMHSGSQLGNFVTVSGMALRDNGNEILVSDSTANTITVFKINSYGKLVKEQIKLTLEGNYSEAKSGWEEVLKLDSNFQPAYNGLALSAINEGDYKTAMEYAKTGYDQESYAIAFEYQRKDFINRNFLLIFIIIFIVIACAITLLVITSKHSLMIVKNRHFRLMFNVMLHPSDAFADIKEKHLGSVGLSILTLVFFYIITVLQILKSGFMFSTYDAATFNSFWTFVRSVGTAVLWIAANWLVCTLLGGNGTFKEITIVTCYSLWPLIIEKIIYIILTNVLLPAEASFLQILDFVAMLYFILLMIIGLLKIHDFSMSRLVGTSFLALLGVAAIIFLLIMIAMLIQQFWGFAVTLVSEVLTL